MTQEQLDLNRVRAVPEHVRRARAPDRVRRDRRRKSGALGVVLQLLGVGVAGQGLAVLVDPERFKVRLRAHQLRARVVEIGLEPFDGVTPPVKSG